MMKSIRTSILVFLVVLGFVLSINLTKSTNPVHAQSTWVNEIKWELSNEMLPVGVLEPAAKVFNDKLYSFGGFTNNTYQPGSWSQVYTPNVRWQRLQDTPVPLNHTGITTDPRFIYLAGGYTIENGVRVYAMNKTFKYDPQTDTWENFVPLPAARGGGALVNLNGELHYFGGSNLQRQDVSTHWTLNLLSENPEWVEDVPMPVGRNHLAAVALDDKIYVVAGQTGQEARSIRVNNLTVWDATTRQWSERAPVLVAVSHNEAASFVLNGKILTIGGEIRHEIGNKAVQMYDPVTDTWTRLNDFPIPVRSGAAGILKGRLYYGGGGNFQTHRQTYIGTLQLVS